MHRRITVYVLRILVVTGGTRYSHCSPGGACGLTVALRGGLTLVRSIDIVNLRTHRTGVTTVAGHSTARPHSAAGMTGRTGVDNVVKCTIYVCGSPLGGIHVALVTCRWCSGAEPWAIRRRQVGRVTKIRHGICVTATALTRIRVLPIWHCNRCTALAVGVAVYRATGGAREGSTANRAGEQNVPETVHMGPATLFCGCQQRCIVADRRRVTGNTGISLIGSTTSYML